MLRLYGRVSRRYVKQLGLLLAGCFLLVCAPTVWCVAPVVVFNGVAAVMDTGSTPLNHPKGVAVDNAGHVYIADAAHNQLVKVTPAGNSNFSTATSSAVSQVVSDLSVNIATGGTPPPPLWPVGRQPIP